VGEQKSGFIFYNFTGTLIKFCISDDSLNEDMKRPWGRQNNNINDHNKKTVDKVI